MEVTIDNSEEETLISELYEIVKDYNPINYDNLFTSISDTFYRENFHSDILCYFFKFDVAKEELINWFNEELDLNINFEDYRNGAVIREDGRRDITLYSTYGNRAIIVENKSNGAKDQEEQLLRYATDLCKKTIEVDGILYINKYVRNEPDHLNWPKDEFEKYKKQLLITKLLGEKSLEQLINRILAKSNNIKLSALAIELKSLFNYVINYDMGPEMDKMYDLLKDEKRRKSFIKIVNSLKDFPTFFVLRYLPYIEQFQNNYAIKKVDKYSSNYIFIEFVYESITYAIDIKFYDDFQYDISITSRGGDEPTRNKEVEDLKQKMASNWSFGKDKINTRRLDRYRTELKDSFNESVFLQTVE
ncbi:MAG: PD-(D/E)XK nuclease family protein, partial [Bacteroidales bacterium]|nr:PD-(D/E)XK nuclease family protein [Bacteroidales bacterium]